MPPPRRRSAPAVEEYVDPELTVMPALDVQYKKQVMPPDRIEMECGECHTTCYVHVTGAVDFDEMMRAELFVSRGGSYKPPLCGFCKRRRDRKRAAGKAA